MLKKILSLSLAAVLFFAFALPAAAAVPKQPKIRVFTLNVGESTPPVDGKGEWTSANPAVAAVSPDGVITAVSDGYTTVDLISKKGSHLLRCEVQVGEVPDAPEGVKAAIASAIHEWREGAGEAFPKKNKYTLWYNAAAYKGFGWCGAFVGYNFAEAGVEMGAEYKQKEVTPIMDGHLHAVRQASQTKLFEGFLYRNRITHLPRPGYYIIYGKKGSTPYTHIALITDVTKMENGQYLLKTVEGNLNSRIKRYCYIYDSLAERPEKNIKAVPESMRSEPETFYYRYVDTFYITAFGQTWY